MSATILYPAIISCRTTRLSDRPILFYFLAALPFVDCIVDQLNNAFHPGVGPVSLLQVLHGLLLVVFASICLLSAMESPERLRSIPVPAIGAVFLIAVICSKELAVSGRLPLTSMAAYGQMLYWVLFWTAASMICDAHWKALVLLRGLAVGALTTACSVFLGFAFGAQNFYSGDAVTSSAGWFDTAKMITGVLVTGGIVLLYLGRKRKGWLHPVLACICFAACVLTYARAGTVALAAVLLWLSLWSLIFAQQGSRRWAARLLLLVALVAMAGTAMMGSRLFARWDDVKQGAQAGSGRATFWKMAGDRYMGASLPQQAFGRGYNAMSEMLFNDYGLDIKHTHNDLLDLLTVGGLAGALWLFILVGTLLWRVFLCPLASIEGAASMAIVLAFLLHGQFTGQIWGTDAMSYYMVSLTCLSILSQPNAERQANPPGISQTFYLLPPAPDG